MIYEKSAGAVVFFRGKEILYLLLHHKTDYWNFPKGNVEKNETEEQAALREINEETGLSVHLIPGFAERIHWFYTRGQKVSKDVVYFLAESSTKDVTISSEHIGYAWLTYEECVKKLKYPSAKNVLDNARVFFQKLSDHNS